MDRIRPICANVRDESDGMQTVALLPIALDKGVKHRLARRPFLARATGSHMGLARCVDRDAAGIELAVLIEHLLSERQDSIPERVNIELRLLPCRITP